MGRAVVGSHGNPCVMAPETAAYFAGFTDGEGTLTIIRQTREGTRTGYRYRALLNVANSDLGVLEWLRAQCGCGSIVSNFHKKLREYHRTVYVLRFNQNEMRHVLPQIVPYLRCKRRQAEHLIAFLGMSVAGTWHQRTEDEWNEIERLRVSVASLNVRGGHRKPVFRPVVVRASRLGNNQFVCNRA